MTIKIQGTNSTAAPGITGGDTDTGVKFGTNEVTIVTNGTDRFKIGSDGAINTNMQCHGHIELDSTGSFTTPAVKLFADTGEIRVKSGGGINFDAYATSGNPSTNLLDDYEEGSWTVTCANSVTLHSNCNTATYTKIGRKITVTGQIRVNNNNSNANLHITNLPFAAAGWTTNTNDGCAVGSVRLYQAGITGACKTLICITDNGDDNLYFTEVRDNQDDLPFQATTNGFYAFNVTYFTS